MIYFKYGYIKYFKWINKRGFCCFTSQGIRGSFACQTATNNNDDIVVKRDKSFKVPKRHEKFYDELDKGIDRIITRN